MVILFVIIVGCFSSCFVVLRLVGFRMKFWLKRFLIFGLYGGEDGGFLVVLICEKK